MFFHKLKIIGSNITGRANKLTIIHVKMKIIYDTMTLSTFTY